MAQTKTYRPSLLESLFSTTARPAATTAGEWFVQARRAYDEGRHAACIELLDRALAADRGAAADPHFAPLEALRWRGRAFQALGDYEQAIADLRRVLDRQPETATGYVDLAHVYGLAGNGQHALDTLTSGIARLEGRQAATLYRERGRIVAAFGRYRDAIDDFSVAIYYYSRDGEAFLRRALAHAALTEWRTAMDDCQRALRLLPDDYRPSYVNAQICFHRGRHRLALPPLARAIELAPANPAPVGLLGQTLLAMKQPREALVFLDKAVELGDRRPATHNARLTALRFIERPPLEENLEVQSLVATMKKITSRL